MQFEFTDEELSELLIALHDRIERADSIVNERSERDPASIEAYWTRVSRNCQVLRNRLNH